MAFNRFKKEISTKIAFFPENGKKAFLLIASFGSLFLLYRIFGCPIKRITGIPCLGCGMSRAWICVLRLHFSEAFSFHPLWPVPLIYLILYYIQKRHAFKYYDICIYFFICLFVITYFIRLYEHDPITEWHIENGMLYHFLKNIKEWIA